MKIRAVRGKAGESGFTLIELLVVVIILGILSGIVVFSITGARENAQVKACKANAEQVLRALEVYYVNKGSYPAVGTETASLVPEYLKSAPPFTSAGAVATGYDYYLTVSYVTVNGRSTPRVVGTSAGTAPEITSTNCSAGAAAA